MPSFSHPLLNAFIVTVHVTVGALLLGLAAVLALWTYRTKPVGGAKSPGKMADFLTLTKPGISFMTGLMALAGFVLGSGGSVDSNRLLDAVVGTLLVSAGACALNMVMEVEVDALMRRTEKRPLPARRLKPGEALFFGLLLSATGLLYLGSAVNLLTAALAALSLGIYLGLYTPLKRVSVLCTAAGAVAGALPPVLGWTAATGRLGIEAGALFAILFFWQFPHFLSFAWLYQEDYTRAGLRMLPVPERDGSRTARSILKYTAALLAASVLPAVLGLAGPVYLLTACSLGLVLLSIERSFLLDRSSATARRIFMASVFYLPLLITLMILDRHPYFL
ncbi:MAG: protoheme IX farnesyltransferase [Elusimicrobia bacterium]|nr:protoheme IX farnesyltransferase [Elusimicrobiota bacterium]